jgi:hypothetical protein
MKSTEAVACVCGQGALEVEVTSFGTWKVEELMAPCAACHRADLREARMAALKTADPRGRFSNPESK